jgi:hypothetical protein
LPPSKRVQTITKGRKSPLKPATSRIFDERLTGL